MWLEYYVKLPVLSIIPTQTPLFFQDRNNRLILNSDNLSCEPVQIYSVLGTKSIDIECKEPIDISNLANCIYFIKSWGYTNKFFKY